MKLLLLGKDGQLGWELQRSLAVLGEIVACGREQADFEDPNGLRQLIRQESPDIIVNAAAYTDVDKAESDAGLARTINTEAVAVLAEEAATLNSLLVHYSTDYVFDGHHKKPYVESDTTSPQSVYGLTKRDGENAIVDAGCRHLILRTSWVFATRGKNFAKTMLRLAKEHEFLKVVCDQQGAPTSAELIADVTSLCLSQLINDKVKAETVSGTFHLTASGVTSWHGFAQLVLQEAERHGAGLKVSPQQVHPIQTSEYPLPAKRPANSRLDTNKLRSTFGLTLPPWQYHVKRLIAEIIQPVNQ